MARRLARRIRRAVQQLQQKQRLTADDEAVRAVVDKPPSSSAAEGSSRTNEGLRAVLGFLKCMCAGHYTPLQHVLREQPMCKASYNILKECTDLLVALAGAPRAHAAVTG